MTPYDDSMPGKVAPINVAVLNWAVSVSGHTDMSLAEAARIQSERLADIRQGSTQPSAGELRRLAKALQRSTVFFFLPNPPKQSDAQVSFRSPPGRSSKRPLNSAEQSALRSAIRWQSIAIWVGERLPEQFPAVKAPDLKPGSSALSAANQLTSWLQWDVKNQLSASSTNQVLRKLRSSIDDHGILVMQFPLGPESCRGFSLPHAAVPLVAINSAYNAAARTYSLLHECAHLLRGDRAVCGNPRNDEVERWCELVAAQVLLPASGVREYVSQSLQSVTDIADVKKIANRFQVSLRATAVRLIQLGLAQQSIYDAVDRIAEYNQGFGGSSTEPQTTPVIRLRQLGAQIPRMLVEAGAAGYLSDVAVRKYLDVDTAQLGELNERIARSAAEV